MEHVEHRETPLAAGTRLATCAASVFLLCGGFPGRQQQEQARRSRKAHSQRGRLGFGRSSSGFGRSSSSTALGPDASSADASPPPSPLSLQGGVGSDTSPAREGTPVTIPPPPSLVPTPGRTGPAAILTLSSPSCRPEVPVPRGAPALEGLFPSPSGRRVISPCRDGGRGGEEVFEGVLSGQKRPPSSHPHQRREPLFAKAPPPSCLLCRGDCVLSPAVVQYVYGSGVALTEWRSK